MKLITQLHCRNVSAALYCVKKWQHCGRWFDLQLTYWFQLRPIRHCHITAHAIFVVACRSVYVGDGDRDQ